MRLNWFLPQPRKSGKGKTPAKRSMVRRVLLVLGPTWLASPVRRVIQTACLGVFLWLLFVVCWPYTARPARVWRDWLPVEVDAETGIVAVETEHAPAEPVAAGMVLHVVDAAGTEDDVLGAFTVEHAGPNELRLTPAAPLTQDELDRLSVSFGPWSLHEDEPGSWPSHYADDLQAKEFVEAEVFLAIDPLVSISTALAGRMWVWSLTTAGVVLLLCFMIPRGFCGYACPLGTLLDLFDWAIGKRMKRLRAPADGWWVHVKRRFPQPLID